MTKPETRKNYSGLTPAQRQERRRVDLIDAAVEMIGEGGTGQISAIGVCKRARLNQRYFSESFASREELLVAALDRVVAESISFGLARWAKSSGVDSARTAGLMSELLDYVAADPCRRALLIESQATPALRKRREDYVAMIAGIIEARAVDVLGDQVVLGVDTRVAALVFTNGALNVVTTWLTGDLDISRDDLINALAKTILAAVRTSGLPPAKAHD